jgi:hypothetical protein
MRIMVQAILGKKNTRLYLKINKAKRTEGVAQKVEHSPSMGEALASTTLPTPKHTQKIKLKLSAAFIKKGKGMPSSSSERHLQY